MKDIRDLGVTEEMTTLTFDHYFKGKEVVGNMERISVLPANSRGVLKNANIWANLNLLALFPTNRFF